MKYFVVIGCLLLALIGSAQEKPIVLVELFTSEGCSSCPAADRLLSTVLKRESQEAEVIGLSFHVDYWNYIGWKDPYSDPRFTERQRAYASKMNSSVYTPQMIVNGRREIVGSSEVQWKHAYGEEAVANAVASTQLFTGSLADDELTLSLLVPPKSSRMIIAVVEKGLNQSVSRGENRGRTLSHDNVVRVFRVLKRPKTSDQIQIVLPTDLSVDNGKVIAYCQDPTTLEISHAYQYNLSLLKMR